MSTTPNTAVQPAATFEERVINRVRDDIGSLMTDAELKRIVEVAVERIFFKERRTSDNYNSRVQPSIFQEVVQTAVEKQFAVAIELYVKEHSDLFAAAIDASIKQGLTKLIAQFFDGKTQQVLYAFAEQLKAGLFK